MASNENRKSVSFTDGAVVFDEDGAQSTQVHQEKATAESHSARSDDDDAAAEPLAAVENDAAFDADLKKKKKKKSKSSDAEAEADGEDFDAAGLKELKKKKKKSKTEDVPAGDDDEMDAAVLKELKKKKKEKKEKKKEKKEKKAEEAEGGVDGDNAVDGEAQQGDMELGTGIWAHESVTPISYDLLLDRFFNLLAATNPGFAAGSEKNYRIPPPECRREGNKKTIFANINEISARVKRTMEHVMNFLFTELGTSGSVDGAQRLVIKGRYQQKQLENVLIKYINEYVLCKTCRSVDTELEKGENRLHFVQCNKCGSRRSAAAIKSGFSAQIGRRKRQG